MTVYTLVLFTFVSFCIINTLCVPCGNLYSATLPFSGKATTITTPFGRAKAVSLQRPFQPVTGFVGIPFAKPPLGPLRFKKPIPLYGWNDKPLDATILRPACIQSNPGVNVTESEDCLYLNIYVPGNKATISENDTKKAVMVWIHGEYQKWSFTRLTTSFLYTHSRWLIRLWKYPSGSLCPVSVW